MKRQLSKYLSKIATLLYQQSCILCQQGASSNIALCPLCEKLLSQNLNSCIQCGLTLINSDKCYCGQCLTQPPYFDELISLANYQMPIDYLITQFKFQRKLAFGHTLGQLLIKKISLLQHKPESIIPIPLHPKRLRQRGYNQAAILAHTISKRLNLPINLNNVRRIIDTKPQADLLAKDRKRNVKHAFQITNPIQHKHIALVDDIVTTGNTINELSRVFKKAGVKRITVWCLARTQLK